VHAVYAADGPLLSAAPQAAITTNDLALPVGALLGRTLLAAKLHLDQAIALEVAFRSREAVEERPNEVAAQAGAALEGFKRGAEEWIEE